MAIQEIALKCSGYLLRQESHRLPSLQPTPSQPVRLPCFPPSDNGGTFFVVLVSKIETFHFPEKPLGTESKENQNSFRKSLKLTRLTGSLPSGDYINRKDC